MQGLFEVGQKWLIETVTLYFVGEITHVGFGFIRLKNASWIHWTGRLSTLIAKQSFDPRDFPADETKPRTEYVGDWTLFTASFVGCGEWHGALPTESHQ